MLVHSEWYNHPGICFHSYCVEALTTRWSHLIYWMTPRFMCTPKKALQLLWVQYLCICSSTNKLLQNTVFKWKKIHFDRLNLWQIHWKILLLYKICLLYQTSNNDRSSHKAVMNALEVIGFSKEEIKSIYQILASILHLVKYNMLS